MKENFLQRESFCTFLKYCPQEKFLLVNYPEENCPMENQSIHINAHTNTHTRTHTHTHTHSHTHTHTHTHTKPTHIHMKLLFEKYLWLKRSRKWNVGEIELSKCFYNFLC